MDTSISTIAPVFISDKFTLNEQISHIKDIISSFSGAVFSSTNNSGKSDHYSELIEVFSCLGGIFRVKEKVKLESVFYNLITCCDAIHGPNHTEFFKALCEGFKSESCKEDVIVRLEYLGKYTVLLLLLLFVCFIHYAEFTISYCLSNLMRLLHLFVYRIIFHFIP